MSSVSASVDLSSSQYSPDFLITLGRACPKITGSPLYNDCLKQFDQSCQIARRIAGETYGSKKALPLVNADPVLSRLKDLGKNEKSDTNYSRDEHQYEDSYSLEYLYKYQTNEIHTLFRCLGIMFKMNSQVLTKQGPVSFKIHHFNKNKVAIPEKNLLSLYLDTAVRLHQLVFDFIPRGLVNSTDTRIQSFIAINRRRGEIVRLSINPSYTSPIGPIIISAYKRAPLLMALEISSIEAHWKKSEVSQKNIFHKWEILPQQLVLARSGDNCYDLCRYFFDTVQQNDEDTPTFQEALKERLPTVCQSLILSYFGPEAASETSLHIQPLPSPKETSLSKSCIVQ